MRAKKEFLFINGRREKLYDSENLIIVDICSSDIEQNYKKMEMIIEDYEIESIIAEQSQIYYAARLLWNNKHIKRYILIDTDDKEINEKQNIRAAKFLWDGIARQNMDSNDEIRLSGWRKSDSGEYFTREEMKEFSDNLCYKIRNCVSKSDCLLEIGVASGISCFAVAPMINKYYGVDISQYVLDFTKKNLESNNVLNVELINCEAIEIDCLEIPQVKMVLMNSVIQYFPGFNYFINVLNKSISMVEEKGYIFFGDVLDFELYEEYRAFRGLKDSKINREQYYSREFFENLPKYFHEICRVTVSDKIGKFENELNMYRYDVLLEIDKSEVTEYVSKQRIAENFFIDYDNLPLERVIELVKKKYEKN